MLWSFLSIHSLQLPNTHTHAVFHYPSPTILTLAQHLSIWLASLFLRLLLLVRSSSLTFLLTHCLHTRAFTFFMLILPMMLDFIFPLFFIFLALTHLRNPKLGFYFGDFFLVGPTLSGDHGVKRGTREAPFKVGF